MLSASERRKAFHSTRSTIQQPSFNKSTTQQPLNPSNKYLAPPAPSTFARPASPKSPKKPPILSPKPTAEKVDKMEKVNIRLSPLAMALAARDASINKSSDDGDQTRHTGANPIRPNNGTIHNDSRIVLPSPPRTPPPFSLPPPPPTPSSSQELDIDEAILPPPPDEMMMNDIPPPPNFTSKFDNQST